MSSASSADVTSGLSRTAGASRADARYAVACLAALAALLAVYANHFDNAFHFDDSHTIQNNVYIRDLANVPRFFADPSTFSSLPSNQSYRPLLTTTLALDYRLGGGLNPAAFHRTSFALFALQCVALLVLFRRLMDRAFSHPGNRWAALFAASLYALHAANAETVNYVIARGDLMSTLGAVLALLMFTSRGIARRWHLYLFPAAAAVLSKEQGAMTAPLLFLYAGLYEHGRSVRELLRPRALLAALHATWPAFVVCAGIVVMGMRLSTSFAPGGERWSYLLTQPFVLLHYVISFVLPANLSADTDWRPFTNALDDRVVVGVVFVVAALWLAVRASSRRERLPIAFGILWFFVALAPTSSLVPLAEVTNDHRMFFPFVGLTLAATWAAALGLRYIHARAAFAGRRVVVPVVAIVVLAAHAAGTVQRNRVWDSEESLWLDVTRKSPENGRGLMTYGTIQMARGNLAEAETYFTRALQYTPRYAYLHVNLGVLKGAQGNAAEAERYFRGAQQYAPTDPVSYYFYARWLHSVGRSGEALPLVRRALELSPGHAEAQQLLAAIEAPPRPDARRAAATTTPATPEQWLDASLQAYNAGRFEESIAASEQALKLRPDYAAAYNNICAAHNAVGRHTEAAAACERALAIDPGSVLARNNLALATTRRAR